VLDSPLDGVPDTALTSLSDGSGPLVFNRCAADDAFCNDSIHERDIFGTSAEDLFQIVISETGCTLWDKILSIGFCDHFRDKAYEWNN
jgi:hypothetical protein